MAEKNKEDVNGYELSVGDGVICDGNETGTVTTFGGIGIFVCMDEDGEVFDWANHQVEKA